MMKAAACGGHQPVPVKTTRAYQCRDRPTLVVSLIRLAFEVPYSKIQCDTYIAVALDETSL